MLYHYHYMCICLTLFSLSLILGRKKMDASDDSNHNHGKQSKEVPHNLSINSDNNDDQISQESQGSQSTEEGTVDKIYMMTLYKAVHKGDWESTKYFLELDPNALTAPISEYGDTILHIAALAGHVKLVEELVYRTPEEKLKLTNKSGETALSLAAAGGTTKVARALVRKNPTLLSKQNDYQLIPVVVAAQFGHVDMVNFLYYMTQEEDLDPENRNSDQGAKLLNACIVAQIYDIALDLVLRYPELAIAEYKDSSSETKSILNTLATRHLAFPSGSGLVFWQQWIYSCIPVHSLRVTNNRRDIEAHYEGSANQDNIIKQAFCKLYGLVWNVLKLMVPYMKYMSDTKLKHFQVLELLSHVCQQVSVMDHEQIKSIPLHQAIFSAVRHGVVEFVDEMLTAYPDIVWFLDGDDRNIFLYAIKQRQQMIFSLLHKLGPRKNLIAASMDKDGNTMLHHAGFLAPSSSFDHISGATLQMQRELQWFKEVEQTVQPMFREIQNAEGETARSLFTSEHKKLRKEGEKWMKETATSCTVVAALVATVMFTAAFTAPGGYNQTTGDPLHLLQKSFMIFILSDAVSLFASSTSALTFLGILKSRYNEEEFLVSLPRKLIIGVFSLFFSIATMMLSFGTAIFIVLHNRLSWISIPIVLLASIPVMIFVFPQVPLIFQILVSTYGPGIFDRPKKRWCLM
ncbi:protein ACCELERATED CELL DEATH 6-like isoform X2 [Cornus florida]|uniref:protein ACCELERATED CELL DEATH 6-like isoform X2 n=1 Tax=Cornus florida TaxID=4283 RepID=UPI00289F9FF0|nr:protein ACCELERATED CELL DEATH 6-like isoform X2 [Cornus florida]